MVDLFNGVAEGVRLIFSGDSEVTRIVLLSLGVSSSALVLSSAIGIPLGVWLAFHRFFGRRLTIVFLYTGMGFPPVVIGLLMYLLLSRSGPLGWLAWLYTPKAMVLAQVVISLPVIASFTMAAIMGVNPNLRRQVVSLGATNLQAALVVLREARVGVLVAIIGGFGSIISEVGAVMMVGGNLKGSSQVLTTAIVQFTRMGLFDKAVALGLILLTLSFLVNLAWLGLQGRDLVEQ
jgi:tungstate transport system permease protein